MHDNCYCGCGFGSCCGFDGCCGFRMTIASMSDAMMTAVVVALALVVVAR